MFEEKGDERPGHIIDLSVVVPAYNEKDRLPAMLDQAIEFLENPKVTTQLSAGLYSQQLVNQDQFLGSNAF